MIIFSTTHNSTEIITNVRIVLQLQMELNSDDVVYEFFDRKALNNEIKNEYNNMLFHL